VRITPTFVTAPAREALRAGNAETGAGSTFRGVALSADRPWDQPERLAGSRQTTEIDGESVRHGVAISLPSKREFMTVNLAPSKTH
jgi:hypothetical protein